MASKLNSVIYYLVTDKSDHQCFHIEKIFTKLSHVVKSEVIYILTSPIIILSRAMRDRRIVQKPWGTTPLQMPGQVGYTRAGLSGKAGFLQGEGRRARLDLDAGDSLV